MREQTIVWQDEYGAAYKDALDEGKLCVVKLVESSVMKLGRFGITKDRAASLYFRAQSGSYFEIYEIEEFAFLE